MQKRVETWLNRTFLCPTSAPLVAAVASFSPHPKFPGLEKMQLGAPSKLHLRFLELLISQLAFSLKNSSSLPFQQNFHSLPAPNEQGGQWK